MECFDKKMLLLLFYDLYFFALMIIAAMFIGYNSIFKMKEESEEIQREINEEIESNHKIRSDKEV